MILAFCIDDQGGLAFNHRRQSRDRALVADLLAAGCTYARLWTQQQELENYGKEEASHA